MHWTQQHRAFVDYGIELLLMFLEGRIRPGKGQIASEQAKEDLKEAMSEPFAVKVEEQIKKCEAEEVKRQEEMQKKQEAIVKAGDNEENLKKAARAPPSELVQQNMRQ